ncbi:MAG: hypothetical protein HC933_17120 [Pleurocapsa sp. SU_196_0]|nr:hypothetical protein [Pleurocapsa sp. SU_196_0]
MNRVLTLVQPRQLEWRDEALPKLEATQVRVKTLFSGISSGTELTQYRGTNPLLSKRFDLETRLGVFGRIGTIALNVVHDANIRLGARSALDSVGRRGIRVEGNQHELHPPRGAHRLVKLMRAVMDAVAPGTVLVTETNVPHKDNIAYFGNVLKDGGTDEAQMVYQFPLPPLVLHTFRTADSTALLNWLRALEPRDSGTAFFNFLASHDGIGVVPATGLVSSDDVMALAAQVERHGGRVNERDTPSGQRPYELCTTLFDALSDPNSAELEAVKIKRFLAANAILLALQGVPGVYVHSLFGSPNDTAALDASGINRRLNRHKFTHAELEAMLFDPTSRASRVFAGMDAMLRARRAHDAFSPSAPQRLLETSSGIVAFERGDDGNVVRCFVNVSTEPQPVSSLRGRDLITGLEVTQDTLEPYEVLWLED